MIGVAGTSPAMTRMGKLRLSAIFFSAISENDDAHKKPGPIEGPALYTFAVRRRLLRLGLEGGDVGVAAQGHHAHLAVAVDGHDDLGHAVTLEQ
jgi:hypothetical protein